ncbi:hypothetical protein AGMMS49545_16060 [Betaproteobacteria bacterium]|nr:hypothetical protein AGMMS49545_16060 [Betaproteobacteria bacterium]GHU46920.1 hypothetical protein AGMMS50289_21340 [Betaproteobacteria bacterium]
MKTSIWILLLAALGLSACGVDVATTAATVGALQAEEARQAKQQQEMIEKQLEETQKLTHQRLQEIDGAASDTTSPDAAP